MVENFAILNQHPIPPNFMHLGAALYTYYLQIFTECTNWNQHPAVLGNLRGHPPSALSLLE
jgi:hypothetical protein